MSAETPNSVPQSADNPDSDGAAKTTATRTPARPVMTTNLPHVPWNMRKWLICLSVFVLSTALIIASIRLQPDNTGTIEQTVRVGWRNMEKDKGNGKQSTPGSDGKKAAPGISDGKAKDGKSDGQTKNGKSDGKTKNKKTKAECSDGKVGYCYSTQDYKLPLSPSGIRYVCPFGFKLVDNPLTRCCKKSPLPTKSTKPGPKYYRCPDRPENDRVCCEPIPCNVVGYTGNASKCKCADGYGPGPVNYNQAGITGGCKPIPCNVTGYEGVPAKCVCSNGYGTGPVTYSTPKFKITGGCKAIPCNVTGYKGEPAMCTCDKGYGPGPVTYSTPGFNITGGCRAIPCNVTGYEGEPAMCTCANGYGPGPVEYSSPGFNITGGCNGIPCNASVNLHTGVAVSSECYTGEPAMCSCRVNASVNGRPCLSNLQDGKVVYNSKNLTVSGCYEMSYQHFFSPNSILAESAILFNFKTELMGTPSPVDTLYNLGFTFPFAGPPANNMVLTASQRSEYEIIGGVPSQRGGLDTLDFGATSNGTRVCYEVETSNRSWTNYTLLLSFVSPPEVESFQGIWFDWPLEVAIYKRFLQISVYPDTDNINGQLLLFMQLPIAPDNLYFMSLTMDTLTAQLRLNNQSANFFFEEKFSNPNPDLGQVISGPSFFPTAHGPIYIGCQPELWTTKVGGPNGLNESSFECVDDEISALQIQFDPTPGRSLNAIKVFCANEVQSEWLGNYVANDSAFSNETFTVLGNASAITVDFGLLVDRLNKFGPEALNDNFQTRKLECWGKALIGIMITYGYNIDSISLRCSQGGFFMGELASVMEINDTALDSGQISNVWQELGSVLWDFGTAIQFFNGFPLSQVLQRRRSLVEASMLSCRASGTDLFSATLGMLQLPQGEVFGFRTPKFRHLVSGEYPFLYARAGGYLGLSWRTVVNVSADRDWFFPPLNTSAQLLSGDRQFVGLGLRREADDKYYWFTVAPAPSITGFSEQRLDDPALTAVFDANPEAFWTLDFIALTSAGDVQLQVRQVTATAPILEFIPYWNDTNWTSCSADCGASGTQSMRDPKCHDGLTGSLVPDIACLPILEEAQSRECRVAACETIPSCMEFQGACWYLGELGENCEETCHREGLEYDYWHTVNVAGSGALNASSCQSILNLLLNVSGGQIKWQDWDIPKDFFETLTLDNLETFEWPWTYKLTVPDPCDVAAPYGVGCILANNTFFRGHYFPWRDTSPTLPWGLAYNVHRVCACSPSVYNFVEKEFGYCSEPCHLGNRSVISQCQDEKGCAVPDAECPDPATAAPKTKACGVTGCEYQTHPWLPCKLPGIRAQEVKCMDPVSPSFPQPPEFCETQENPVLEKPPCLELCEFNECFEGTHNCDVEATCTNVEGSFECACNPGYSGNGTVIEPCVNIDECALGIDNCSEFAVCNDTIGSFTCTCINKFFGNGVDCVPRTITGTVVVDPLLDLPRPLLVEEGVPVTLQVNLSHANALENTLIFLEAKSLVPDVNNSCPYMDVELIYPPQVVDLPEVFVIPPNTSSVTFLVKPKTGRLNVLCQTPTRFRLTESTFFDGIVDIVVHDSHPCTPHNITIQNTTIDLRVLRNFTAPTSQDRVEIILNWTMVNDSSSFAWFMERVRCFNQVSLSRNISYTYRDANGSLVSGPLPIGEQFLDATFDNLLRSAADISYPTQTDFLTYFLSLSQPQGLRFSIPVPTNTLALVSVWLMFPNSVPSFQRLNLGLGAQETLDSQALMDAQRKIACVSAREWFQLTLLVDTTNIFFAHLFVELKEEQLNVFPQNSTQVDVVSMYLAGWSVVTSCNKDQQLFTEEIPVTSQDAHLRDDAKELQSIYAFRVLARNMGPNGTEQDGHFQMWSLPSHAMCVIGNHCIPPYSTSGRCVAGDPLTLLGVKADTWGCAIPTCTDGLHNGDESDLDCGGTCGSNCEQFARCRTHMDCRGLMCLKNLPSYIQEPCFAKQEALTSRTYVLGSPVSVVVDDTSIWYLYGDANCEFLFKDQNDQVSSWPSGKYIPGKPYFLPSETAPKIFPSQLVQIEIKQGPCFFFKTEVTCNEATGSGEVCKWCPASNRCFPELSCPSNLWAGNLPMEAEPYFQGSLLDGDDGYCEGNYKRQIRVTLPRKGCLQSGEELFSCQCQDQDLVGNETKVFTPPSFIYNSTVQTFQYSVLDLDNRVDNVTYVIHLYSSVIDATSTPVATLTLTNMNTVTRTVSLDSQPPLEFDIVDGRTVLFITTEEVSPGQYRLNVANFIGDLMFLEKTLSAPLRDSAVSCDHPSWIQTDYCLASLTCDENSQICSGTVASAVALGTGDDIIMLTQGTYDRRVDIRSSKLNILAAWDSTFTNRFAPLEALDEKFIAELKYAKYQCGDDASVDVDTFAYSDILVSYGNCTNTNLKFAISFVVSTDVIMGFEAQSGITFKTDKITFVADNATYTPLLTSDGTRIYTTYQAGIIYEIIFAFTADTAPSGRRRSLVNEPTSQRTTTSQGNSHDQPRHRMVSSVQENKNAGVAAARRHISQVENATVNFDTICGFGAINDGSDITWNATLIVPNADGSLSPPTVLVIEEVQDLVSTNSTATFYGVSGADPAVLLGNGVGCVAATATSSESYWVVKISDAAVAVDVVVLTYNNPSVPSTQLEVWVSLENSNPWTDSTNFVQCSSFSGVTDSGLYRAKFGCSWRPAKYLYLRPPTGQMQWDDICLVRATSAPHTVRFNKVAGAQLSLSLTRANFKCSSTTSAFDCRYQGALSKCYQALLSGSENSETFTYVRALQADGTSLLSACASAITPQETASPIHPAETGLVWGSGCKAVTLRYANEANAFVNCAAQKGFAFNETVNWKSPCVCAKGYLVDSSIDYSNIKFQVGDTTSNGVTASSESRPCPSTKCLDATLVSSVTGCKGIECQGSAYTGVAGECECAPGYYGTVVYGATGALTGCTSCPELGNCLVRLCTSASAVVCTLCDIGYIVQADRCQVESLACPPNTEFSSQQRRCICLPGFQDQLLYDETKPSVATRYPGVCVARPKVNFDVIQGRSLAVASGGWTLWTRTSFTDQVLLPDSAAFTTTSTYTEISEGLSFAANTEVSSISGILTSSILIEAAATVSEFQAQYVNVIDQYPTLQNGVVTGYVNHTYSQELLGSSEQLASKTALRGYMLITDVLHNCWLLYVGTAAYSANCFSQFGPRKNELAFLAPETEPIISNLIGSINLQTKYVKLEFETPLKNPSFDTVYRIFRNGMLLATTSAHVFVDQNPINFNTPGVEVLYCVDIYFGNDATDLPYLYKTFSYSSRAVCIYLTQPWVASMSGSVKTPLDIKGNSEPIPGAAVCVIPKSAPLVHPLDNLRVCWDESQVSFASITEAQMCCTQADTRGNWKVDVKHVGVRGIRSGSASGANSLLSSGGNALELTSFSQVILIGGSTDNFESGIMSQRGHFENGIFVERADATTLLYGLLSSGTSDIKLLTLKSQTTTIAGTVLYPDACIVMGLAVKVIAEDGGQLEGVVGEGGFFLVTYPVRDPPYTVLIFSTTVTPQLELQVSDEIFLVKKITATSFSLDGLAAEQTYMINFENVVKIPRPLTAQLAATSCMTGDIGEWALEIYSCGGLYSTVNIGIIRKDLSTFTKQLSPHNYTYTLKIRGQVTPPSSEILTPRYVGDALRELRMITKQFDIASLDRMDNRLWDLDYVYSVQPSVSVNVGNGNCPPIQVGGSSVTPESCDIIDFDPSAMCSFSDFKAPIVNSIKDAACSYLLTINAREDHSAFGGPNTQCADVFATVEILDDVSSPSIGTPIPATIFMDNGQATFSFRPALPNIVCPFTRSIEYTLLYEERSEAGKRGSRIGLVSQQIVEMIVLGNRPRTPSFIAESDGHMPWMIIRDPPGDASYTSWSESKAMTFSITLDGGTDWAVSAYGGLGQQVNIQASFGWWAAYFGTGEPFTYESTSTKPTSGTDVSYGHTSSFSLDVNLDRSFSTDAGPDLPPPLGDLIIGGSVNFKYGLTDRVLLSSLLFTADRDVTSRPGVDIVGEERLVCSINKAIFGAWQDPQTNPNAMYAYSHREIVEMIRKLKSLIELSSKGGFEAASVASKDGRTTAELKIAVRNWISVLSFKAENSKARQGDPLMFTYRLNKVLTAMASVMREPKETDAPGLERGKYNVAQNLATAPIYSTLEGLDIASFYLTQVLIGVFMIGSLNIAAGVPFLLTQLFSGPQAFFAINGGGSYASSKFLNELFADIQKQPEEFKKVITFAQTGNNNDLSPFWRYKPSSAGDLQRGLGADVQESWTPDAAEASRPWRETTAQGHFRDLNQNLGQNLATRSYTWTGAAGAIDFSMTIGMQDSASFKTGFGARAAIDLGKDIGQDPDSPFKDVASFTKTQSRVNAARKVAGAAAFLGKFAGTALGRRRSMLGVSKIGPVTFQSGWGQGVTTNYGRSDAHSSTTTQTVSIHLEDSNAWDMFWMDIYEDKVFGTPIFRVAASQTMCSCEAITEKYVGIFAVIPTGFNFSNPSDSECDLGSYEFPNSGTCMGEELKQITYDSKQTTCNEQCQLEVVGLSSLLNVDPDEDAAFLLKMTSLSPSDLPLAKYVIFNTNPENVTGLRSQMDGALGFTQAVIEVEPGASVEIDLRLTRLKRDRYEWPGIELACASPCDTFFTRTTIIIAVSWQRPAPYLKFATRLYENAPLTWSPDMSTNSPSKPAVLDIAVEGFEFPEVSETVPEWYNAMRDTVKIQYRPLGSLIWFDVVTFDRSPINLLDNKYGPYDESNMEGIFFYNLGASVFDTSAAACPPSVVALYPTETQSLQCLNDGAYELRVYSSFSFFLNKEMNQEDYLPLIITTTKMDLFVNPTIAIAVGQVLIGFEFTSNLACDRLRLFPTLIFQDAVTGVRVQNPAGGQSFSPKHNCNGAVLQFSSVPPLTPGSQYTVQLAFPARSSVLDVLLNAFLFAPVYNFVVTA